MLVDSLENWWLDFYKCLLIGKLSDPRDAQFLKSTTTAVGKIVKKLNRTVSSEEEALLELLISSYGYLTHQQLIYGLQKSLSLNGRAPENTEILNYLRKMEPELEKLKEAKRNPVILVLDKVGYY